MFDERYVRSFVEQQAGALALLKVSLPNRSRELRCALGQQQILWGWPVCSPEGG